jgi:hypothetical protein
MVASIFVLRAGLMVLIVMIMLVWVIIMMQVFLIMKVIIVIKRRRNLRVNWWRRLLLSTNGAPTFAHRLGLGTSSRLALRRVDGVTAPVAVTALRNIRNDQFVIDPAPERPALWLSFFDSALARHDAGTRGTGTAGRGWSVEDRNRRAPPRTRSPL